jgi:hypothetical protein
MSSFSTTCDALIEDMLDNVVTLQVDPQNIHRYQEAFPEQLQPDGSRHLAVFPAADRFDSVNPSQSAVGFHDRHQVFTILVWEPATGVEERQVSDEQGAKDFLDLYEAVQARLYVDANQSMAGAYRQWFFGSEVPVRTQLTRSFRIHVERASTLAFTAS